MDGPAWHKGTLASQAIATTASMHPSLQSETEAIVTRSGVSTGTLDANEVTDDSHAFPVASESEQDEKSPVERRTKYI